MLGNSMTATVQPPVVSPLLAKSQEPRAGQGVTIVVFSGDFDRVQAAFNFLGLGPVLMRRLMGEFRMPSVDQMLELGHSLGVKYVACTITMGVMGLTKADLRQDLVSSYAGVATYLRDARDRAVNLFI